MPYDVLLVDLDGTVYKGPDAIDGAVESLEKAREAGVGVSYVTNNASRGPKDVAEHLARLGLTVTEDDVVTSAQAGAAVLADRCEVGAKVLVLGTEALAAELSAVGLVPVREAADDPVAVVQGHSPETGWAQLAEATIALRAGADWVACNVDPTLPSDRGMLPGNGSMVAALRAASDREPVVAGKPAAPLLRQAVEREGATAPLVVGDRLDTDIAGAHAVDAPSLLVLTGVSTAADLLAARPDHRPTYVAADLRILGGDLEACRVDADRGDGAGPWNARRDGDTVVLSGSGDDATAALRALCRAVWADDRGEDVPALRGEGDDAAAVITALGLGQD